MAVVRQRRFLDAKRIVQFVALGLAAVAAVVLLTVPGYTVASTDSGGDETLTSQSLVDVNGAWVLLLLAVPIVLTAVPAFVIGAARPVVSVCCTIVFGVCTVLAMLTLGMFFVPALIAAVVAACLPVRSVVVGRARLLGPAERPRRPA